MEISKTFSPTFQSLQPDLSVAQLEPAEKEFDAHAIQYESALNEGLSISGEGPDYFAGKRIAWTASVLPQNKIHELHTALKSAITNASYQTSPKDTPT